MLGPQQERFLTIKTTATMSEKSSNNPFMSLKNMRNEILILKNYNRYKTIEKQIIKQYIKQLVVSNVR